jgi:hypothetical protein
MCAIEDPWLISHSTETSYLAVCLIMLVLCKSHLYKPLIEKWTVHLMDRKFIFIRVSEMMGVNHLQIIKTTVCTKFSEHEAAQWPDILTQTDCWELLLQALKKIRTKLYERNDHSEFVLSQQSVWHCMNHREEFWCHCQIAELHFLIICFLEKGPRKLWYRFKSY